MHLRIANELFTISSDTLEYLSFEYQKAIKKQSVTNNLCDTTGLKIRTTFNSSNKN